VTTAAKATGAALPHVRRWVIAGASLVIVGYVASLTIRLAQRDVYWISTGFAALGSGIVGLFLAIRHRVRAAALCLIGVVWLQLHLSILLNAGQRSFGGVPVFPPLVVATGLFFGEGAGIALAITTTVTVPAALLAGVHLYHLPSANLVLTLQQVAVLDVTMIGSAILVWQGLRALRDVEAARRSHERQLGLLVEHSPYGIARLDQVGRVESLNPAGEAVLGTTAADAHGRLFTEILGSTSGHAPPVLPLPEGDTPVQTEVTLQRPAGRRLVEVSASRTVGVEGDTGIQIMLRDVTGRREMERHAIQLGRMLDQAPSEVYVFDAETLRLRFANLGARRNLGYEAHELDKLTVTDVAPALTRPELRRLMSDLTTQPNEAVGLTGQHRRKDGSAYAVEARLHLLSFAEQPAVGLFALDVSERAALERTQGDLRARMQQAQRFETVQRLAGGIAHQFNNLLMSVGGYADMIKEFAKESRVRDWAERIRVGQQRGADLIRRLQGLARTDVAQPERLPLGATIRTMLPVLERTLGTTVHLELSTTGHDEVLIDRAQLEQVVLHLATNARDAMPAGATVTIAVAGPTVPDNGEADVILEVRDTGHGMTPETIQRAFDPFFTEHRHGTGTGLGLTAVRGIVTQAGGAVELESTPGTGTIARVRLPLVAAASPSDRNVAASTTEISESGSGTVLLVEDDEDARAVVAHALTRAGYEVRAVATAEAALELLMGQPGDVDLVLTDVVLPGMTGFALGAEIATRFPFLRVLYMSGDLQKHMEDAPAGFAPTTDLLLKPFAADRLISSVRVALRHE
jgi:PAS domain S-box-containing protein